MKLFVIAMLVACGTASTGTQRSTLDSIPSAAAAALKRQAGGAKIENVAKEREGGRDVYEATWYVDGLEREAAVTADGELVEYEEEVDSANVPSAVRAAAIVKLPNATTIRFSKLQDGTFEAEAIIDGRKHDVTLTPDGRDVSDDDDDDDEDDDD